MASLEQRPQVEVGVALRLTEQEARALHALTEYGTEAFLKHFYTVMGKSCLEPYEAGLVSLFASVRNLLPPILGRARAARVVFNGVPEFTSDQKLVEIAKTIYRG